MLVLNKLNLIGQTNDKWKCLNKSDSLIVDIFLKFAGEQKKLNLIFLYKFLLIYEEIKSKGLEFRKFQEKIKIDEADKENHLVKRVSLQHLQVPDVELENPNQSLNKLSHKKHSRNLRIKN